MLNLCSGPTFQWFAFCQSLCKNPIAGFKNLYDKLNLTWSQKTEGFLIQSNKKGNGFSKYRIAKNEIDKWKRNLTIEQIKNAEKYLKIFNLSRYD